MSDRPTPQRRNENRFAPLTPNECSEIGTYGCVVPMACGGIVAQVDYCVADIVAALNAASITTTWSCCGHGVQPAAVGLLDGRVIHIEEATDE